jgi:hypothetical protein
MKNLALSLVLISANVFASGWNCTGELNEIGVGPVRVKLVNKTTAPRTPAVLVVSNSTHGTLVKAVDDEIVKTISRRATEYSVTVNDGDKLRTGFGVETVDFGVNYREGVSAPLKNGETVTGYLNVQMDDHNEFAELLCKRYLKTNE